VCLKSSYVLAVSVRVVAGQQDGAPGKAGSRSVERRLRLAFWGAGTSGVLSVLAVGFRLRRVRHMRWLAPFWLLDGSMIWRLRSVGRVRKEEVSGYSSALKIIL
jgi:hypothetical protein